MSITDHLVLLLWYGHAQKSFVYIVLVQIRLHAKHQTQQIGWSIGRNCASRENLAVASNTFYEKECALAVNQQYTLTCKSSNENGWNSNFLIVENKAYCENFTTGPEEVHNITLLGNKTILII